MTDEPIDLLRSRRPERSRERGPHPFWRRPRRMNLVDEDPVVLLVPGEVLLLMGKAVGLALDRKNSLTL